MVDQKINILHLRDAPWVWGPGRTILESGARIDSTRYGYYIGSFCRRDGASDNTFFDTAVKRGLNVFRIEESLSLDPTVFVQVSRLIRKNAVDIIHTHEVRSDIVGLLCGKLFRIPVITTVHGWIENNFKGKIVTRLDKGILRFFDHVIAVSEKIKEEVLRSGLKEDRVTVLRNALVIENYLPDREDHAFRRELGASDETLLVGNIGRLSPEKGQTDFIRAAAVVSKTCKDAKFVIIGKGNDEACLRQLAEELGVTNAVIFAGYRAEMQHIYNSLNLVVQSSYTEGMPNVILEALAMEIPVIATDVGGTPEAVISNETGVLISPGKPEELAKKILLFIQNREMFREMAKKGRRHVESNFNFNERTQKLSLIYDRIGPLTQHARTLSGCRDRTR